MEEVCTFQPSKSISLGKRENHCGLEVPCDRGYVGIHPQSLTKHHPCKMDGWKTSLSFPFGVEGNFSGGEPDPNFGGVT